MKITINLNHTSGRVVGGNIRGNRRKIVSLQSPRLCRLDVIRQGAIDDVPIDVGSVAGVVQTLQVGDGSGGRPFRGVLVGYRPQHLEGGSASFDAVKMSESSL